MTIDERLDRLTERHEAVAQSLEMLTADVREYVAESRAFAARTQTNMDELRKHMIALVENNNKLSNIIIAHDAQLDDHERRLEDLEGGKR
jgi:DNA repair exonuclease SbcCD ATPase subunit